LLTLPDLTGPDGGAIADVQVGDQINYETESGRWLRSVVGRAGRDDGAPVVPQENRGSQRLRLVSPLPPDCPALESIREDDTPAPEAQRAPVAPPPSSRSPLWPSRR
jgi:hypothetical protein